MAYNPGNSVKLELLLNFDEFWSRLAQDISAAQNSVLVQTFALEGDCVGLQLADALSASTARDRRVLADSFTRIVLSDRFRYSPKNLFDRRLKEEAEATRKMLISLKSAGTDVRFTNAYAWSPRRVLSRNHKKLIVIDDSAAYIGGINFSEHNAAWHDMMVRLEHPEAVRFLRKDFNATWDGCDRPEKQTFADVELFTLDGRDNRRVFQRVLDLIDSARDSIFVESPYITFPFYDRLRDAAQRGVRVQIVTPERNNWSYFASYARLESAGSDIDLRLYGNGMSHLKAMLIDGQYLIAGSSNFDYLSYRLYQEIIGIFTAPGLIADFQRRVVLPDLNNSVAADCRATLLSKQWLGLQMRVVDAALTILT